MNNMMVSQVLLLLICACWGTKARISELTLQSQYLRAISAYRRLERSLPPQDLRSLTALGLLNGARQTEHQMEQHLVQAIKKFLQQTDFQASSQVLPKIDEIEKELLRDQRALNILGSAIDVISSTKNQQQFLQELHNIREQQAIELQPQSAEEPQLGERLGQLRLHILAQVPQMKIDLDTKIKTALQQLMKQATNDGILAKFSQKALHKRAANEQLGENQGDNPKEMHKIKSIMSEIDFRENLVEQQFDKSDNNNKQPQSKDDFDDMTLDINSQNVTVKNNTKINGTQETGDGFSELGDDDADNGGGGGGGIVGIIGSLSGGEGGSDVGALIGALTGLISTLFGPGGLDIESLISTATSLLAGLLSGNKNFGVVLGQYVGTAFDGLSGGGGAINNGQFLGHFFGTVLAALSADPEDEGLPQPLTFTKNFVNGFLESKFRPMSDEALEARHGSSELPHQKKKEGGVASFDSGMFVKQITSHLVNRALGLLLNSSLGASGGASQASAGLFSSSSHHMKSATGGS
ncbi:uncharacterized protein LOC117794008 [Drosophila innubila]|uniref:uncharacterized protein LOC117794008 n=1 Tax=Drosophila innubila TaxID=198719 RepID=UPI00148BAC8E|nr:uncharacterized protein LOC117794008 [Drosophila innubila]